MRKNLIVLLSAIMICILVFPAIEADNSTSDTESSTMTINIGTQGYVIDQMQTMVDHYYVIDGENAFAQSFIPEITPLAKIRLLLGRTEENPPTEPLMISIRKTLSGEDLVSYVLYPETIYSEQIWVNCDFKDSTVSIGETYYIVVSTERLGEDQHYNWYGTQNIDHDRYEKGSGWVEEDLIWYNMDELLETHHDFCFITYSYSDNQPALHTEGTLAWPNRKPGSIVNDSFTISNVGDENSLLNWRIVSYPEWGEWTFSSVEGIDLTPAEGPQTIMVSVVIPDEPNKDFNGTITIENLQDPEDIATLSITMSTPYRRHDYHPIFMFLLEIMENLPFFSFFF